jgi:predicted amidohydrolase
MPNKKLTRRRFLGTAASVGIASLATPAFAAEPAAGSEAAPIPQPGTHDTRIADAATGCGHAEFWQNWRSTSNQPPRKVIVGTVMQRFWGTYPGLDKRLAQLTEIVDQLQELSQKQYGRGLDVAILPETAVTGEVGPTGKVADSSYPLEGPVNEAFAQAARRHHCYIVATLYLQEEKPAKLYSNAAVLYGRQGEVVGMYGKVHPVVDLETGLMEHGVAAGKEEPVFACDFGKLGLQICYDINFDYGWEELWRKGAELVAWPTQSPGTTTPSCRAMRHGYYIVSSTWRNNASVFDPTGKIVAQIKEGPDAGPDGTQGEPSAATNILVQEIDLSYGILPWSPTLKNGKAFTQAFGDKVGFRYYEDDDRGIFWSNDPNQTVGQMIRSLRLTEEKESMQPVVQYYRKLGVPR